MRDLETNITAIYEPSVSRTEVTIPLLSDPHKVGVRSTDQQKLLGRNIPLSSRLPIPGTKHALLSPRFLHNVASQKAQLKLHRLFKAQRERLLPPGCSLTTACSGCQAWRGLGRPGADEEGAARPCQRVVARPGATAAGGSS